MQVSILRRYWVMFSACIIAFYAQIVNRLKVVGGEHLPEEGGPAGGQSYLRLRHRIPADRSIFSTPFPDGLGSCKGGVV